jgi:membrane fusion protein, copper/silver efflux system
MRTKRLGARDCSNGGANDAQEGVPMGLQKVLQKVLQEGAQKGAARATVIGAVLGAALAGACVGAGAIWWLGERKASPVAAAGGAKAAADGEGRNSAADGRSPAARKIMYTCAMHPNYITDKPGNCPICGMTLVQVADHGHSAGMDGAGGNDGSGARRVRIDSVTLRNMGVRTEKVEKRALASGIRTSGKIAVDESRQVSVNARVGGWVEVLRVSATGRSVRKGETLLELYSPDLVASQEEYRQALHYAGGAGAAETGGAGAAAATETGSANGKDAGAGTEGSRELVESARRRLVNLGVPEERIRALERGGAVGRTVPVAAPASGVVLEKFVIQGQNIMPGTPLFRIADLGKVWVVANAYQSDLARVKVGAAAEIALSYLPGKAFQGRVAFVSPVLDPETRTAEVRIEVANTASLDLKPEMFATVTLRAAAGAAGVAVPEQALIRSGRRDIAIVAIGDGYFEPREVRLGSAADGYVEVLEGLHEGENLVVSSQFLIDSESNLKAAIEQLQGAAK